MKKLIIMSALVMGGLGVKTADAQIGIRVNLHFGGQPVYAPAPPPVINEPVYDDYFYLPEVEAYYSVGERCYYYNDGERWISAAYLPGRYHDFDWRSARRYEVRTNRPYLRHDVYRGKFGGYVNRDQFYARAYPGRGREQFDNRGGFNRHDEERGRNQYDNRGGWNRDNDRNDNRNDNYPGRNQGGYDQPDRNQGQGGYNQPDRNQGGYNQGGNQSNPGRNQGGYGQPNQNQGGYGQPAQNQGGQQQQPSQGQGQQGGGRGNGQGGQNNGNGQSQPSRNGGQGNGGQNSGGYNGGSHYAANQMGVVQDRGEMARPVRQ